MPGFIDRDPDAEVRTRRALDKISRLVNDLLRNGTFVLGGSGYTVNPALAAAAANPTPPAMGDDDPGVPLVIPGERGPAGATGPVGGAAGQQLYFADIVPAAPDASDDEFNDGVLGGAWTLLNNAGNLTYTEGSYGAKLVLAGTAADSTVGVFRTVAAGDFAFVTKLSLAAISGNFAFAGILAGADLSANPTTAAFRLFVLSYESGGVFSVRAMQWTNYLTYLGQSFAYTGIGHDAMYLRVRRIATTLYYDVSNDGLDWMLLGSEAEPYPIVRVGLGAGYPLHAGAVPLAAYFRFFRKQAGTGTDNPVLGGFSGIAGATGLVGATGPPPMLVEDAEPGAPGPPGDRGTTGATGNTGPTGNTGEVGAAGLPDDPEPSLPGPPGDRGPTGATGATGPVGDKGAAGFPEDAEPSLPGPPGNTGPTGAQGIAGSIGPRGSEVPPPMIADDAGSDWQAPGGGSGAPEFGAKAQSLVLIGPQSGVPAVPTFRPLINGDLPVFDLTVRVTGILGRVNGGTGLDLTTTGPGVLRQATAFGVVSVGQALDYAVIRDEKAASTEGGSNVGGTTQTRTLNTSASDTGVGMSLATNQFTLQPGTFRIRARCPAYRVGRHQATLYNVTLGAVVLVGTGAYSENANNVQGWSWVEGRFTIAVASAFEIRHFTTTTVTTQGFGLFGDTLTAVYTVVELWREV